MRTTRAERVAVRRAWTGRPRRLCRGASRGTGRRVGGSRPARCAAVPDPGAGRETVRIEVVATPSAIRRPPSRLPASAFAAARLAVGRGPRAVAGPGIEVGPGIGSCGCASRVETASLPLVIPRPSGWVGLGERGCGRAVVGARDADHSRGAGRGRPGSAAVLHAARELVSDAQVEKRDPGAGSRNPDGSNVVSDQIRGRGQARRARPAPARAPCDAGLVGDRLVRPNRPRDRSCGRTSRSQRLARPMLTASVRIGRTSRLNRTSNRPRARDDHAARTHRDDPPGRNPVAEPSKPTLDRAHSRFDRPAFRVPGPSRLAAGRELWPGQAVKQSGSVVSGARRAL
jgi:hypothetical protein